MVFDLVGKCCMRFVLRLVSPFCFSFLSPAFLHLLVIKSFFGTQRIRITLKFIKKQKYKLIGIIGYYWILLDIIGYHWILLDIIRYYWILFEIVRYYWILLDIIGWIF